MQLCKSVISIQKTLNRIQGSFQSMIFFNLFFFFFLLAALSPQAVVGNSDTLYLVVYLYKILLASRSCVNKNNSPTRQLTDSKQNIVLRACFIVYDILTPKFNLWIYVGS